MRTMLSALCLAAMALPGCGPSTPTAGSSTAPLAGTAPAALPAPTASFKAEYKAYDDGAERPVTHYAAGGQMRVEGPPPARLGATGIIATIMDPVGGRTISFRVGPGAPKYAMVTSLDTLGEASALFFVRDRASAHVVGADTVAGFACRIWQIDPVDDGAGRQMCVTDDGMTLRINPIGEPAKPTLLADSILKGAQDAALFAVPADYEVVDYSPCLTLASDAMEAAQAGRRPDMARVQQCEDLGKKISGIFATQ